LNRTKYKARGKIAISVKEQFDIYTWKQIKFRKNHASLDKVCFFFFLTYTFIIFFSQFSFSQTKSLLFTEEMPINLFSAKFPSHATTEEHRTLLKVKQS